MTNTMTPAYDLQDGEEVLAEFRPDRATYVRTNTWMAVAAMAGGMFVLWILGNPYVWTGAIGGLAAVAVRSFYLMSEELAVVCTLSNQRLMGPFERRISLGNIKELKTLGSFAQVITHSGDKHLIKYQAPPADTIAAIKRGMVGGTP
jgi:hypothetical protein